LGEILLPNFGSEEVIGEIPRVLPKYSRESLSEEDLQKMANKLEEWVNLYFDLKSQSKYFTVLTKTVALFSAYTNPFNGIETEEMELFLKLSFWCWHTDDFLEMAIGKGIPFRVLETGLNQLLATLNGDGKCFQGVQGCPGFGFLYNSLLNIQESLQKHNPGYKDSLGSFQFFLRRYFDAMSWYAAGRVDFEYSEETFKFWRRIISFFDGIASIICLVNQIILPTHILKSPLLQRILDITNSSGGFVNDLLGLRKEFQNKEEDNLVVFKVLQKGIPLQVAVREVCDFMKTELMDYMLLRDVILRKFSWEPSLVKYIDILESMMDGHNRVYAHSERHLSVGKVEVTI